ncbi:MAG: 3-deoxy-D-manno-octulosonic acid transferase [Bdellovibrionales bacterium]
MILLYRLFIIPLVALILPFFLPFLPKLRSGLGLRLRPLKIPEFANDPIWIHAASGEFEYAKAVIRELKLRHPDIPIVVTYFSPTYRRAVETFEGIDFACPLPLDLPGPCASFLKRVHPRALWIARTDFWPEMITQTARRKIPRLVFAYTQRDPSQMNILSRALRRWVLIRLDQILCVAEGDREALKRLGLDDGVSVSVAGDTRYDQVEYRLRTGRPLPPDLKPDPGRFCLVAGSTWEEDELVLIPAVQELLKAGRLKLIVVPHEPTDAHLKRLRTRLEAYGLTAALFSSEASWPHRHALIVDEVGVLAELYRWGDFALVGGSFRKSVHSVMEALGAGCRTFVGPKHHNNREALEFQALRFAGQPGVTVVADSGDLRAQLEKATAAREALSQFRQDLIAEFQRRRGASERVVAASLP